MPTIYRLEHRASRLGPFTHRGQLASVVRNGIHANRSAMCDLDDHPQVAPLLGPASVKFGFASRGALDRMIKNLPALTRRGFVIVEIKAPFLYHHPEDDQVVFLDKRAPFKPTDVSVARGAAAQQLCGEAFMHKLYMPQRMFSTYFRSMINRYVSHRMKTWVCGLAYDGRTPIGVFFSSNEWVGVYVKPDYRRLGVGTALMNKSLPLAHVKEAFTHERAGIKFFQHLGVPVR